MPAALLEALDRIKSAPAGEQAVAGRAAVAQLHDRDWPQRAKDLAQALTRSGADLGAWFRLELAWQIRNDLEDTVARWDAVAQGNGSVAQPASTGTQPQPLLDADPAVRPLLARIVQASTTLTQKLEAREQLTQALSSVALGKGLNANLILAGCVPDPSTRAEVLLEFSSEAKLGAVDAARGIVYRTSTKAWCRGLTYLSPLLFFVLSGAALVGVSELHGLLGSGFPVQLWGIVRGHGQAPAFSWSKLLGPYLLVMAGVIARLIVENLKQAQAGVPIIAIGDMLTWLQLRWVGLALTYVPVLVVAVGLSALGVGDSGHDLTLWLAAGFSVDSTAGLLLNRFDTGSKAFTALKRLVASTTA